jgi:enolase
MALCKAGAALKKIPLHSHLNGLLKSERVPSLPIPFLNVLNGGQHAGNLLAFQEFMVVPIGAATFQEAMFMGCKLYFDLKSHIALTHGKSSCNVGDEGGFAPSLLKSPEEALQLITSTISKSGLEGKMAIALDIAASEFFCEKDGTYNLSYKWDKPDSWILSKQEYIDYLLKLQATFPSIMRLDDAISCLL